jgi:hypothetical protein
MLVLENGETWAVYDGMFPPPTSQPALIGGLYGKTTFTGNSLFGSGNAINETPGLSFSPTTYSGTFDAKNTIAVTASNGVTFNASYQPGYDQPASLAVMSQ